MDYNAIHQETYDLLAEEYEARVPALRPVFEEAISYFAPHLKKGERVLDVGCGAGLAVQILDVRVRFNISEALDTQREQPKDHDLDGYYEFGHSRFNTKRVPSGRLTLHITDADAYWANGCRKSWRDSEKQRIEDRLNRFVAGLVSFAARKKEHDAEEQRRAEPRGDTI